MRCGSCHGTGREKFRYTNHGERDEFVDRVCVVCRGTGATPDPPTDEHDAETTSLRELVKELREGLAIARGRLLADSGGEVLDNETLIKTLRTIDALIAKADKATGDE